MAPVVTTTVRFPGSSTTTCGSAPRTSSTWRTPRTSGLASRRRCSSSRGQSRGRRTRRGPGARPVLAVRRGRPAGDGVAGDARGPAGRDDPGHPVAPGGVPRGVLGAARHPAPALADAAGAAGGLLLPLRGWPPERLLEKIRPLPRTLCHYDFDNRNLGLRETPEGAQTVVIDWEIVGEGLSSADVGRFLAYQQPANVEELVGSYLDELERNLGRPRSGRGPSRRRPLRWSWSGSSSR